MNHLPTTLKHLAPLRIHYFGWGLIFLLMAANAWAEQKIGTPAYIPTKTTTPMSATDIMAKVNAQPLPDSSAIQLKMELTSRRGNKSYTQMRVIEIFTKKTAQGTKTLLRFKEPADVAGVTLLAHENPGGLDDQWLYMPALKQEPKRISSNERNNNFLGTDFTYADFTMRRDGKWQYALQNEDAQQWVIQSVSQDIASTYYTKLIQSISKDKFFPTRIEFYNKNGLMKVLTATDIVHIDGFWVAKQTLMETEKNKHSTRLTIIAQKNNLAIADEVFTLRYMKQ